ncbi:MAG: hypothetical protein ACI8QZ_004247 [Chlamydiales bacterium]|jgi:hypothetical protein
MLIAQVVASFFFGTHYLLSDAWTGAGMNLIAMLQALLAIPLGNRPGFRIAYLVTLPVIGAVVWISWAGLPSAFAAAGFALISLGRYQLSPVRFRIFMLAAIPAWVAHNILVGSIPGLIADACAMASGAWMLKVTLKPTE